jgi:hypothetical protein
MKPYNDKNWWIDPDIVRPVKIQSENVKAALQLYRETVESRNYIQISNNAIKNPAPMYRGQKNGDPLQVGYVITGKTEFEKGNRAGWSMQYIDLWVSVEQIETPDF